MFRCALVGTYLLVACGDPESVPVVVDAPVEPAADSEGRIVRYLFEDDPADGLDAAAGYPAACTRCPVPVSGRSGGALEFDGAGDLVHARSPALLDGASAFSAAAWVRLTQVTGETGCVLGKPRAAGDDNIWQLCITPTRQLAACMSPPAGGLPSERCRFTAAGALSLGTWHHLALTFDGGTMRAYVDTSEVIQAPQGRTEDASRLVIGADVDQGASGYYLQGAIDDVRIWIRALSAAEIATEATLP